jgi:enterochelin esterase-like enzyme
VPGDTAISEWLPNSCEAQMRPMRLSAVVLLLFFVSIVAPAGTATAQPPGGGRGGPIRSPEVAADGKVTFRLRAPNAKEVIVVGFGQKLPMQKDEQGVWTATTDVLKADIYTYSFSVDGATFNDPNNGYFKTSYRGGWQNQFRVPGTAVWDPGPGPKGAISRHFYKSAVVGDDRDYYVYTPPDYDRNRKEPYPVLYLLHGLSDDAAGWLSAGSANTILDNLITQGKARPMIMVNPLGYGTADMLTAGRGNLGGDQMMPNFAKALLDEVMPQVEKNYRVATDRNQRAIAGLSMGGAEALFTGLNHLDRFAYVASFSGAFVMWPGVGGGGRGAGGAPPPPVDPAAFAKHFPGLDAKANTQLRMLLVACGTEDGLMGVNRDFKDWLKSKDIRFTDTETPGFAHVWGLWREDLAQLAPLLFRSDKKVEQPVKK